MSRCDRLLCAHECYEEGKASEEQCQKCPYGYGKYDDSGDHAFWTCDSDKLHNDLAILLRNTKACLSTIVFMLEEYKKPDSEKRVIPFKTTEDMANYFLLMVGMLYYAFDQTFCNISEL